MISLRSNISSDRLIAGGLPCMTRQSYDLEMANKIKLKLNLGKILVILIVGFVFAGTVGAEDWAMFQHDLEHTGETSDVIENPEDLGLAWIFKTEYSEYSSPVVSGNNIYAFTPREKHTMLWIITGILIIIIILIIFFKFKK